MADTHINAYFADVEEAHQAVLQAHGEWEAAKLRLETKKKEVGYVEPETPKAEETTSPQAQETKVDDKDDKSSKKK